MKIFPFMARAKEAATGPAEKAPRLEYKEALDALLTAFDIQGKKLEIVESMPTEHERFELVDLLNVMGALGYRGAPARVRLCDIDDRLLPCLFVDKKGEPRVISVSSASTMKGLAYIFNKVTDEDLREQRKVEIEAGIGWFQNSLSRFRRLVWSVVCLSFAIHVVSLMLPFFILAIYDWIADAVSSLTIESLVSGAVLTVFIEAALRNIRSKELAWFASRTDFITGVKTFSHLLRLPSFAIERASVSSQVSRLKSFESARDFFTSSLFLTLLDVPFTALAVLALFFIGGYVAFVPLAVIGLTLLSVLSLRPRMDLGMHMAARKRGEAQARYMEAFEKIDDLRMNGMSELWCEKLRELSASSSMANFRMSFLGQVEESLSYIIATVGSVALVYIGVLNVLAGGMTSGALFASIVLYWRLMGPWQALYGNIPKLRQIYSSFVQMDKLFVLETEREAAHGVARPEGFGNSLAFANVGLRYTKNSDPVCVGLSFLAEKGMFVTVAGNNGSGKTTILKLALGLYKPQAGAILIDRQDIRQIDPDYLRKSVAYVPQVPELFNVSVADNVRYGNPLATDEEVWHALELADADVLVAALPDKMHTKIEFVSGSHRAVLEHKIALARAYVKDASLLLIDEIPYSLLSGAAGKKLMELVGAWRGRKTILMVSHRDDILRMSDRTVGLLNDKRFVFDAPEKTIRALRDDAFLHQRRIA